MEDDWSVAGSNSLNFASELRAVILDCRNTAVVTCRKQNAGGIAGWQSLGLIKECQNSGRLDAEKAEYVGGIVGQSIGYVRSCWAKGELSGLNYVGGIAGSAAVTTDCRSMVVLKTGTEKKGMILGFQADNTAEVETPMSGNLYFAPMEDFGGIDGISYAGKAEPMEKDDFFGMEDLPGMFRNVTLRFLFADDTTRSYTVPVGGEFAASRIPAIPEKSGCTASWEGVTDAALKNILFDQVFEAKYVGQTRILQSETEEGVLAKLLIQGVFGENAALALEQTEADITLEKDEVLLETWRFTVTGAESLSNARIRVPEGVDAETVRVMLAGESGDWHEVVCSIDGSYLVIPIEDGDNGIALIQVPEFPWWIVAAAAACGVLLIAALPMKRRKMAKK